jgi:RecA/RadA recombinase
MADPTKIKDMADMAFRTTIQAKDQLPKFISQQNVMVNGVPTTRELQVSPFGGPATTVAGSAAATYNKPAANVNVTTNLPAQEKEFEKELGTQQAKTVIANKTKAEDAAQILATNQVAKNLLDKGMITGVGAEFFTTLNQGLSQAGIDFGLGDAAKNSQAYGALMATNTARLIKNFGAGTGLSDADREYAKKAAAGDIKMDEKAIRRILEINNTAAKNAINLHNKNVANIKTNIPLSVNPADYSAGIPEGRSTTSAKRGQQTLNDIFK